MADQPANGVVCNCGPLIALGGIHQLSLLRELFPKVWVPAEVHRELTAAIRFVSAREQFNQAWLEVVPSLPSHDEYLAANLDAGEAAVITLGCHLHPSFVLIDERKTRRVAERVYHLPILGTGGLLLRAKKAGLISRVQPLLTAMQANGYHLGTSLVNAVCQAASETPP